MHTLVFNFKPLRCNLFDFVQNHIRQTLDVIAENLEGQDVDGFEAARELSDVINPSTLLGLKYNRSFLEVGHYPINFLLF